MPSTKDSKSIGDAIWKQVLYCASKAGMRAAMYISPAPHTTLVVHQRCCEIKRTKLKLPMCMPTKYEVNLTHDGEEDSNVQCTNQQNNRNYSRLT